jgi:putative glutamine amidotransferase
MIIAISQRSIRTEKDVRDALENSYVKYYEKFGITLLPISNVSSDIKKYFENNDVKGIILSGGDDIDPKLYGEEADKEKISKEREQTEKQLIEIAIEKKIPLLGVCRGAQFLNVYFGGKLIRDIKKETGLDHVATQHKISLIKDEISNYFNTKEAVVNSYHNQGINKDTLSNGLEEFAAAEDGSIEGFYHPAHNIAAIMWHPERDKSDKDFDEKLIRAFLDRKLFWSK